MRHTKIVCTIGTKTVVGGLDRTLSEMVRAGMDVLRINMSYAQEGYPLERSIVDWARERSYRVGERSFALLADLQGIKYRVRGLAGKKMDVPAGKPVRLIDEGGAGGGDAGAIPLPHELYRNLVANLEAGMGPLKVYLGDGDIILFTEAVQHDHVRCRVLVGGELKEGKGITLQGIDVTPPDPLTEKDKKDIRFIVEHGGFTFVDLSFVQSGEDIRRLRRFMIEECGCEPRRVPPIIAKIETLRGFQNLEDILDEAYGVMVARGDLGLQVGVEQVTEIQKEIIHRCLLRARPVVTATQMLESMESSLEPRRAEASDIFNAVLDGTDALMLSGETSAGQHPVAAVAMMARIATAAEDYLGRRHRSQPMHYLNRIRELQAEIMEREHDPERAQVVGNLISHAAAVFASNPHLPIKAIITPTASGRTCRLISRFRPLSMIVGVAHEDDVRHALVLSYGVIPIGIRKGPVNTVEQIFGLALRQAARRGLVRAGEQVIFSGGYPMWQRATTNLIKLHHVTEEDVRLRPSAS